MKKGIHPKYYVNAKTSCACGAVLEAGSTIESMEIEICSVCHPFFSGKKKTIDTTGRVDRFKKLTQKSEEKKAAAKKSAKPKKVSTKKEKVSAKK